MFKILRFFGNSSRTRAKARAKATARATAMATAMARATARRTRARAKDRARARDGRTVGRTDGRTAGRSYLFSEMRNPALFPIFPPSIFCEMSKWQTDILRKMYDLVIVHHHEVHVM